MSILGEGSPGEPGINHPLEEAGKFQVCKHMPLFAFASLVARYHSNGGIKHAMSVRRAIEMATTVDSAYRQTREQEALARLVKGGRVDMNMYKDLAVDTERVPEYIQWFGLNAVRTLGTEATNPKQGRLKPKIGLQLLGSAARQWGSWDTRATRRLDEAARSLPTVIEGSGISHGSIWYEKRDPETPRKYVIQRHFSGGSDPENYRFVSVDRWRAVGDVFLREERAVLPVNIFKISRFILDTASFGEGSLNFESPNAIGEMLEEAISEPRNTSLAVNPISMHYVQMVREPRE